MEPTEFGIYLKKLRKEKRLSTHKLAELSGVSQSYISHVENGRKENVPSPEILHKLSGALEIAHSTLMLKAGLIKDDVLETEYEIELQKKIDNDFNQKIKQVEDIQNNLINTLFNPKIHLNGHDLSMEDRKRIVDMIYIMFPYKRKKHSDS